jgi:5-methylcytosine-specific restriction endonuclease McrA
MDRARDHVYGYLKSHPCSECGEKRLPALEFHHVNKDEKYKQSTRIFCLMNRGYSIARINKEISKCIVLCSSCHRCVTAKEQGWYKSK